MWTWCVLVVLLQTNSIISSQPVTDENVREVRQLNFGDCCPCPTGLERTRDQHVWDNRLASLSDDCPCRSTSDTDASPSILSPVMRAVAPARSTQTREEPKNILEPEVGLASSVLETLRKVTDEEYEEALARDAARSAIKSIETDDFIQDTPRNIVNIIMKPNGRDSEDDALSEASHTHETRCIHSPLGRTNTFEHLQLKPAGKLLEEVFTLPQIPAAHGLLHQRIFDMDNSPSNVQEHVLQPIKHNLLDDLKLRSNFLNINLLPNLKTWPNLIHTPNLRNNEEIREEDNCKDPRHKHHIKVPDLRLTKIIDNLKKSKINQPKNIKNAKYDDNKDRSFSLSNNNNLKHENNLFLQESLKNVQENISVIKAIKKPVASQIFTLEEGDPVSKESKLVEHIIGNEQLERCDCTKNKDDLTDASKPRNFNTKILDAVPSPSGIVKNEIIIDENGNDIVDDDLSNSIIKSATSSDENHLNEKSYSNSQANALNENETTEIDLMQEITTTTDPKNIEYEDVTEKVCNREDLESGASTLTNQVEVLPENDMNKAVTSLYNENVSNAENQMPSKVQDKETSWPQSSNALPSIKTNILKTLENFKKANDKIQERLRANVQDVLHTKDMKRNQLIEGSDGITPIPKTVVESTLEPNNTPKQSVIDEIGPNEILSYVDNEAEEDASIINVASKTVNPLNQIVGNDEQTKKEKNDEFSMKSLENSCNGATSSRESVDTEDLNTSVVPEGEMTAKANEKFSKILNLEPDKNEERADNNKIFVDKFETKFGNENKKINDEIENVKNDENSSKYKSEDNIPNINDINPMETASSSSCDPVSKSKEVTKSIVQSNNAQSQDKEMVAQASDSLFRSISSSDLNEHGFGTYRDHILNEQPLKTINNFLENVRSKVSGVLTSNQNMYSNTNGLNNNLLKKEHNQQYNLMTPPLNSQRSNSKLNSINSYKAKVPLPKSLDIKSIPKANIFDNVAHLPTSSNILKRTNTPNVLNLKPLIKNEALRSPQLEFLRPKSNVFQDSLDTVGNLKSEAENAIRNVQKAFENTNLLKQSKNSENMLNTILKGRDNINEKFETIHMDLNDRLSSISESITDNSGASTFGSPFLLADRRKAKSDIKSNVKMNPLTRRLESKDILDFLKLSQPAHRVITKPKHNPSRLLKQPIDLRAARLNSIEKSKIGSKFTALPQLTNSLNKTLIKKPIRSKGIIKPIKNTKINISFATTARPSNVKSDSSLSSPQPASKVNTLRDAQNRQERREELISKLKYKEPKTLASDRIVSKVPFPDGSQRKTKLLLKSSSEEFDLQNIRSKDGFSQVKFMQNKPNKSVLSKIRENAKGRASNINVDKNNFKSEGILEDKSDEIIDDLNKEASENVPSTNLIKKPLEENVAYKCKMLCVKNR